MAIKKYLVFNNSDYNLFSLCMFLAVAQVYFLTRILSLNLLKSLWLVGPHTSTIWEILLRALRKGRSLVSFATCNAIPNVFIMCFRWQRQHMGEIGRLQRTCVFRLSVHSLTRLPYSKCANLIYASEWSSYAHFKLTSLSSLITRFVKYVVFKI